MDVEFLHGVPESNGMLVVEKGQTVIATSSKVRVLVVDDEEPICLLLHNKLLSARLESHTCTSGREALQLLSHQPFDAIISDLRMPGVDGFDLLKAAHRCLPHAPFLAATGTSDIEAGVAAMKMGATDFLLKPFNLDLVLAKLERGLRIKKMEKELEGYRKDLEKIAEESAVHLQAAVHQIEQTYDETLDALASALDLRDNETAGHSRRVTLFALKMATVMECSKELSKQLRMGALLHDVGKIGIPDSILLKAGKLTPEETLVMRAHVRIGHSLMNRITFLAPAAEIVLAHHERFDGAGYPQGLHGNEIPLGARIFAVADTLDAVTSDRPYRRARSFMVASKIIAEESEKQFDPTVVDAFRSISVGTWETIRHEVALVYPDVQRVSQPALRPLESSRPNALVSRYAGSGPMV